MKNQRTVIRHSKKSSARMEGTLDTALKSSFLGILFTAGVSLALLFASTAAALMTDDPISLVEPIGYVVKFISAFLGGFICSKIDKRVPYMTSAIVGGAFVILSMLFSLALPHSLASGMNIGVRLALHALSFVMFPLGALLGVKASKPKRKAKKRR